MDVVAYTRVSTEEQGDSGLGLAAQRAALEAAARARGWKIVRWEEDICSGGEAPEGRPGFQRAEAALAGGEAQALTCMRLDRLSRSLSAFALLADRFQGEGWGLAPLDVPHLEGAQGKLVAGLFAVIAEYERALIGQRTSAAMQAAKAQGRHMGRPFSKAGIKNAQRIRDMRAQGLSYARIAQELNAKGIRAPAGKCWHPGSVRRIARRSG